jgi:ferredoxin-NADP reductase
MKLTFVESIPKEGDARSFVFSPAEPVSWLPGQFTRLTLPLEHPDDRGDKRWFTISAAPSEGKVAITTRIFEGRRSTFKQALSELKPGDQVEAADPEGDFVLGDPEHNYLFVAGGIGITPFRSMLAEADIKKQWPHITLLYANRDDDAVFKGELEAYRQNNPNLAIRYVISPDRLDAARIKAEADALDNPLIYISGPEPMVEQLTEEVASLGVAKEDIKSDYFPGYEAE